jgi:hypothetical protein
LFDALIKKFSTSTTFEVAEIYEAFEELEVSLDKARNDVNLDKVVRIGANHALFILGKYYNKLDECEVYPIATSAYSLAINGCIIHPLPFHTVLTPTKTYCWFKKNVGWAEEWKQMPLDKLHHRWVTTYKPKPEPKASPMPDPEASHESEPPLNVCPVYLPSYVLIWSTRISHINLQLLLSTLTVKMTIIWMMS